MKRDIRMIALDLDGTVFNNQKQMTPGVTAAIRRALDAGIVVLPATGRQITGVPKAFLDIPGVHYALVGNGARIYDLKKNELLHSDCFPRETTLSLLRECRGFGALLTLFIDGGSYAEVKDADFDNLEGILPDEALAYMRESRTPVPDLESMVNESSDDAEKLALFFYNQGERQRAYEALRLRSDIGITSSLFDNLELNTPTANKGAGLLLLGELLGLRQEQIMAVGDSSNDRDMLEAAGYGVAMGNADEDLKRIADAVTLTNEEDGVAATINAIF